MLRKEIYKTEILACPVCGAKHRITTLKTAAEYYLDGMPKSDIEKYIQQYCICSKCGAVYYTSSHPADVKDPIYCRAGTPEIKPENTEERLEYLKQYAPHLSPNIDVVAAHYYYCINNREAELRHLESACQTMEKLYHSDIYGLASLVVRMPATPTVASRVNTLSEKYTLLDVYRRLGKFTQANEMLIDVENDLLNYCKRTNRTPANQPQYYIIQKQRDLINTQCTDLV